MISVRYRRLTCLLLALVMIVAMLPVHIFAEETGSGEETVPPVTEVVTEPTEPTPPPTETVPEPTEETPPPAETVPATEPVPPPPAETVPEETVSEETVPEETVPEETVPLTPEEELQLELETMYQDILLRTEKESLSGFCATLVSWELFLSGVSGHFLRGDGKDQYDNYKDLEKTAGGYYVLTYSAEDYTLKEALMAITQNGTRDVGRVLIGFEKTRSPEGALYGHTVFIGGIIDGNVYYVESNDYTVAGVEYPEGTPIVCTIDQFAYQYSGWTTFEGAVEFSETRYRDECEFLPTDVYIRTEAINELRTEPCLPDVSPWSRMVRGVRPKEVFRVNAIVQDTQGEYWYQTAGEKPLYLSAQNTSLAYSDYSGAAAQEMFFPGEVNTEGEFDFTGIASAGGSTLRMVRGQVFSGRVGEGPLVRTAAFMVDTTEFDLEELSDELQLENLKPGIYHCVISVIVRNTFLRDGELKYRSKLLDLWTAEFRVPDTEEEGAVTLHPVLLDLQGGTGAPQQILLEPGTDVPEHLIPVRNGYRFEGWSVYEETEEQTTAMHACWSVDTEALDGWQLVDGQWRCYEAGQPVIGLVNWDSITYFVNADGSFHTGWMEANKKQYYFFENGASARGILTVDKEQYVFDQDGAVSNTQILECFQKL